MNSRLEQEGRIVASHFPRNVRQGVLQGRSVWVFTKFTEVGIKFEIAIYFDPDEPGYVAQCIGPEIEAEWRTPHIGHIYHDGVICLGWSTISGRPTSRAAGDMLTAYSKSCLWAEGIACMIVSKRAGRPTEFPFSNNNREEEV
jgi:hypothetical protein